MSRRILFSLAAAMMMVTVASAQQTRVNVIIENLAPSEGTSQSPIWIGFHDGTFDTYSGGLLASDLPIPGSVAMERLAEDGNAGPLSSDFIAFGRGTKQDTLASPNGPVGPGVKVMSSFLLDNPSPLDRYFSYASMILPSNDAFIANGSPLAHKVFDDDGNFVAEDFLVFGPNAVNDAGTEVNDEIPANTAFFGQTVPNTGVTENNPIITHPGFNARFTGGILDDPRFRNGDFSLAGYPFLRVSFRAAPAVTGPRGFATVLSGFEEVPAVATPAIAIAGFSLIDTGTRIAFTIVTLGLQNIVAGHLHFGAAGTNGPVVASLLPPAAPGNGGDNFQAFTGVIDAADLTGPFADFPIDELVRRIDQGEVYINLHTNDGLPGTNTGPGDFASGELRGQLAGGGSF